MNDTVIATADYTLGPKDTSALLLELIEARQPVMIWGQPGIGKSTVATSVAAVVQYHYLDIRPLLMETVDFRGIPWRDEANRTRWASPSCFPPENDPGNWLLNYEELPAAVPSVQAALYQLVLDNRCGEYTLPPGASQIACGNRVSDRGVAYRMPSGLASRFIHIDMRVSVDDWCEWAAKNDIAPEVLFFVQMRPKLLNTFDPASRENAFACPRTWEFVSNRMKDGRPREPHLEKALFRGTVGEGPATEFCAFLRMWREMPHPKAVIGDPENAIVPDNASALFALCGSLYEAANDVNFDAIVRYAKRLRREIGAFLVGSALRKNPALQHTQAFVSWASTNTH